MTVELAIPHAGRLAMPDRMRLAILDTSSEFVTELNERVERLGWRSYLLSAPASPWTLARMKLHTLVVDPAVIEGDSAGWLHKVRRDLPDLRIVVCTGPSTLSRRVDALQTDVDDWVTKPCAPDELLARVESIVRGPHHIESALAPTVHAGELVVSPNHHQAFARGISARLTRREFSLLSLLARHEGDVIDRPVAYAHVWGHPMLRRDRSVDVHVRRIRDKLARVSPGWRYIHTHYKVGYCFQAVSHTS